MGHSVHPTTELYGWILDEEHETARTRLSEADAEPLDLDASITELGEIVASVDDERDENRGPDTPYAHPSS